MGRIGRAAVAQDLDSQVRDLAKERAVRQRAPRGAASRSAKTNKRARTEIPIAGKCPDSRAPCLHRHQQPRTRQPTGPARGPRPAEHGIVD